MAVYESLKTFFSPAFRDAKWIVSAYAIVFGLIAFAYFTPARWPLLFGIVGIIVWDLLWAFFGETTRNAQEMLDSTVRVRTYMSYMLIVYGSGLTFLFLRSSGDDRTALFGQIGNADLGIGWLVTPIFLCTVAIMFFPIQLGGDTFARYSIDRSLGNREPTDALTAVVAINAAAQKLSLFIIMFITAVAASGFDSATPLKVVACPTCATAAQLEELRITGEKQLEQIGELSVKVDELSEPASGAESTGELSRIDKDYLALIESLKTIASLSSNLSAAFGHTAKLDTRVDAIGADVSAILGLVQEAESPTDSEVSECVAKGWGAGAMRIDCGGHEN